MLSWLRYDRAVRESLSGHSSLRFTRASSPPPPPPPDGYAALEAIRAADARTRGRSDVMMPGDERPPDVTASAPARGQPRADPAPDGRDAVGDVRVPDAGGGRLPSQIPSRSPMLARPPPRAAPPVPDQERARRSAFARPHVSISARWTPAQ